MTENHPQKQRPDDLSRVRHFLTGYIYFSKYLNLQGLHATASGQPVMDSC